MTEPEEEERIPFLPTDRSGRRVAIYLGIIAVVLIALCIGAERNNHVDHLRLPKETMLMSFLQQIRHAIEQFHTDTGVYPATLTDLSAVDKSKVKAKIKPGSYKGPYLAVSGGIGSTGIPVNPFKHPSDADYLNPTAHWKYDAKEGIIHPAVPVEGVTLDGLPYSEM